MGKHQLKRLKELSKRRSIREYYDVLLDEEIEGRIGAFSNNKETIKCCGKFVEYKWLEDMANELLTRDMHTLPQIFNRIYNLPVRGLAPFVSVLKYHTDNNIADKAKNVMKQYRNDWIYLNKKERTLLVEKFKEQLRKEEYRHKKGVLETIKEIGLNEMLGEVLFYMHNTNKEIKDLAIDVWRKLTNKMPKDWCAESSQRICRDVKNRIREFLEAKGWSEDRRLMALGVIDTLGLHREFLPELIALAFYNKGVVKERAKKLLESIGGLRKAYEIVIKNKSLNKLENYFEDYFLSGNHDLIKGAIDATALFKLRGLYLYVYVCSKSEGLKGYVEKEFGDVTIEKLSKSFVKNLKTLVINENPLKLGALEVISEFKIKALLPDVVFLRQHPRAVIRKAAEKTLGAFDEKDINIEKIADGIKNICKNKSISRQADVRLMVAKNIGEFLLFELYKTSMVLAYDEVELVSDTALESIRKLVENPSIRMLIYSEGIMYIEHLIQENLELPYPREKIISLKIIDILGLENLLPEAYMLRWHEDKDVSTLAKKIINKWGAGDKRELHRVVERWLSSDDEEKVSAAITMVEKTKNTLFLPYIILRKYGRGSREVLLARLAWESIWGSDMDEKEWWQNASEVEKKMAKNVFREGLYSDDPWMRRAALKITSILKIYEFIGDLKVLLKKDALLEKSVQETIDKLRQ